MTLVKNLDKPWYQSKKFASLIVLVGAFFGGVVLGAPSPAIEYLALGVMMGGTTLIGVQGWADGRGIVAAQNSQLPGSLK